MSSENLFHSPVSKENFWEKNLEMEMSEVRNLIYEGRHVEMC